MSEGSDQIHLLRRLLERNQHTLEDKISELSLLRVVNEALASEADAPDQMRRVVAQVVELTDAEGGDVLVLHGQILESIIDNDIRPPASTALAESVAEKGEPETVSDSRDDPRFASFSEGCPRSLLAFPLVFRSEVLGVLLLWHGAPGAFDAATERVLHLLAGQLAVAAKNMDLLRNLRAAHNYRDNLINSSADAILTTDTRATVVLANRQAARVWGIDPGDLAGRPVGEGLSGGSEVEAVVVEVLRRGEAMTGQRIRLTRPARLPDEPTGGTDSVTLDVEVSCSPIQGDAGRIIGTVTILTRIEDRLRLEQQLVASESMASKGRMAAEIGHELANFMNGIMGHASLIPYMLDDGDTDQARKSLDLICRQVEGTARFAHSLMDFSRLETSPAPGRINEVIRNTIQFVKPQNSFDRVSFETRLDPADPIAAIDDGQIQQILVNLFKNAAEAAEGEPCTIGVISLIDAEGRVSVVVEDDGPGLPEEVEAALFERAVTTKKDGHGFGLPICKRIATNHGGDLVCRTTPGEGTTFTLTLGFPLGAPTEAREKPAAAESTTGGGSLRLV